MLFVHLYLPHTPADYIKQKLSLNTNNINEDYFLNLIYTDFVLSRIINEIKNNRKKDLLIVLNSLIIGMTLAQNLIKYKDQCYRYSTL